MPSLSFCIPTYNRSACLAELLDSIIAQGVPDIEVAISDDASPDDTATVVESYKARLPGLKYLRQPVNIGLDRNFRAVTAAASGDFVWLLGDDDRLEPGALAAVMAALEAWPGLGGMTVGVIDYDPAFVAPTGIRHMPPTVRLTSAEAVFEAVPELLGFMSATIFDRRMWNTVCDLDPVGAYENYYSQVYIIGRIMSRGGDWGVLNVPCIGFRTSNDQFLSKFGWLKRTRIDVVAYDELARGLFPNAPKTRRRMRDRIFKTHIMSRINNAKTGETVGLNAWETLRFLAGYYRAVPAFWYRGVPTVLAPAALMRKLRQLYRKYSSGSGANRAQKLNSASNTRPQ